MDKEQHYSLVQPVAEKPISLDERNDTVITIITNNEEDTPPPKVKLRRQQRFSKFISTYRAPIWKVVKIIIAGLFLAYVGYSMTVEYGTENSLRLLIGTILGYLLIAWKWIKKTRRFIDISEDLNTLQCNGNVQLKIRKFIRWGLYIAMLVVVGSLVGTAVAKGNLRNLLSLAGLFLFVLLLYATSVDRKNISWHSVFWGFGVQFTLGILVLHTKDGKDVVTWISTRLNEFLKHSAKGSEFIFGPNYSQFHFAFAILPKVIFFVATIRVLNHLGVLRFMNRTVGSLLSFCTGTSTPESICAAANIFVGGGQAILFIKEYLSYLTDAEVFCVLVGDVASIGGGAVVFYSGYGIPIQYLISASVMSAPAGLAAAKLSYPSAPIQGMGDRKTRKDEFVRTESNALHALSQGASQGLSFVASISVNLLVLLAVLDFFDTALEWFGARAGLGNFNFEMVSSYLFYPFAFLMGVDSDDCFRVGNLLGLRSLLSLPVAYIKMGNFFQNKNVYNNYTRLFNDTVFYQGSYDVYLPQWNQTLAKGILSDRSEVICAYALCGFASLSSLGISIGSITVLAPKFIGAVTRLCPRAMVVGTFACYFTACVAGMIYQEK